MRTSLLATMFVTGLGVNAAHADVQVQIVTPVPGPPAPVVVSPQPPAPPTIPEPHAAPQTFGYQPPNAGPGYQTALPQYQQGYYLYSANGGAPVYYAPPPGARRVVVPPPVAVVKKPQERIRRFSFGIQGAALILDQKVGGTGKYLTLGGAGFNFRIRGAGHFGIEFKQDFLGNSYGDGGFVRSSFPFTTSMLFYLFRNSDERHFNVYASAGLTLQPSHVKVRFNDQFSSDYRSQSFVEVGGQAGLGAELRFKWFALAADARFVGLFRANDGDSQYYGDGYYETPGGPVPAKSAGFQGSLFANFWF